MMHAFALAFEFDFLFLSQVIRAYRWDGKSKARRSTIQKKQWTVSFYLRLLPYMSDIIFKAVCVI